MNLDTLNTKTTSNKKNSKRQTKAQLSRGSKRNTKVGGTSILSVSLNSAHMRTADTKADQTSIFLDCLEVESEANSSEMNDSISSNESPHILRASEQHNLSLDSKMPFSLHLN